MSHRCADFLKIEFGPIIMYLPTSLAVAVAHARKVPPSPIVAHVIAHIPLLHSSSIHETTFRRIVSIFSPLCSWHRSPIVVRRGISPRIQGEATIERPPQIRATCFSGKFEKLRRRTKGAGGERFFSRPGLPLHAISRKRRRTILCFSSRARRAEESTRLIGWFSVRSRDSIARWMLTFSRCTTRDFT